MTARFITLVSIVTAKNDDKQLCDYVDEDNNSEGKKVFCEKCFIQHNFINTKGIEIL